MVCANFRWLLPIGHLLVDFVLLASLTGSSVAPFQSSQGLRERLSAFHTVRFQEDVGILFEPKNLPPRDEFLQIISGNPAAGLLSAYLRPDAAVVTRGRWWDRIWFLLHEVISFACWYLLGAWVDSQRLRVRVVMLAYLFMRVVSAAAGLHQFGWRAQIVFWLVVTLFCLVIGLIRLCRVVWRAVGRPSG